MRTTSVVGARNFLLLVDDFSKKMWILKKKSDAFVDSKVFNAIVEKKFR
jgi:hypothetical protein